MEDVLLRGAAAVKGEGGAREGVGCCCCDNSDVAPPTGTTPVPIDDPSAAEKTPVETNINVRMFFIVSVDASGNIHVPATRSRVPDDNGAFNEEHLNLMFDKRFVKCDQHHELYTTITQLCKFVYVIYIAANKKL